MSPGRGIPPRGVAPRSDTPGILARRALRSGRRARDLCHDPLGRDTSVAVTSLILSVWLAVQTSGPPPTLVDAVMQGSESAVTSMLDGGADANGADETGMTA